MGRERRELWVDASPAALGGALVLGQPPARSCVSVGGEHWPHKDVAVRSDTRCLQPRVSLGTVHWR